ncbi:Phosphate acetyltransferase [Candidatus Palibaumannia cicadellinicola]|uniref:Phosphate acetyltransferase n=2 Tax=Candidatus Palibaumannia cicadellinicola TaxID=186490 RepID=A0A0K2BKR5_9GAMM|nr:Phosphate acetyltransferase [Candidatus Baumannia cicadellinicola]
MLIPIGTRVGLTSISLGIIRAMEQNNIHLNVFTKIATTDYDKNNIDLITSIICNQYNIPYTTPLSLYEIESLICSNQKDLLMEKIIACYHKKKTKESSIILLEGIRTTSEYQFANVVNYEIATMLKSDIIFVLTQIPTLIDQLKIQIKLASAIFGKNNNITGVIINKINAPIYSADTSIELATILHEDNNNIINEFDHNLIYKNSPLPVLGCIPWNIELIYIRAIDIARHLSAIIINQGDIQLRIIKSVTCCTGSLPNMLNEVKPSSLIIIEADRTEVIAALGLAINSVKIGAVLLTSSDKIDPNIYKIFAKAFQTGLPVFTVPTNTCQTLINLKNFKLPIPVDEEIRLEKLQNYIAGYIDKIWIKSLKKSSARKSLLSPQEFRYQITEQARKANKRIILPEGDEPRTIKAASICSDRGIATCILLGNPTKIKSVATLHGIELSKSIKIIDPVAERYKYLLPLVKLRQIKGMTDDLAREQLKDNVVLGTMMLAQDEVDGLVSGAVHTTANTIRPPLQLIRTAPGYSLVSSVFFMLLPEQVLVYGDCAINTDPTSEQLAEIAIQSANSATDFGIEPRVALISYSTGNSGVGSDVDKVRKATYLAKSKRPDLIIDGPLQYDAAIIAEVALSKAPNSPVAGKATVLIFPDLNTGNTTYKAVQRTANLISIGPVLQGLRKPVNDLSRGALVDDIVYTIAITSIQANNAKKK